MSHERLLSDLRRLVRMESSVVTNYRIKYTDSPSGRECYEDLFKLESELYDIQYKIEQLIKKYCDPLSIAKISGDIKTPLFCGFGGAAISSKNIHLYDIAGAFINEWEGMF